MELADEIRKLKDLHDSGALSDTEFAQAKAALLAGSTGSQRSAPGRHRGDDTLGTAAKKWVNFQIVMAIVGILLFLVLLFGFFLPNWNKSKDDFGRRWNEFPTAK